MTFTHLPMIPTVDCLRETIVQGVAEGQFAYARGSAEKNEFHSIKIGVAIDQSMIEFLEDTYLLRTKFAYELLGAIPPPKKGEPKPIGPEPGGTGEPTTPPKGGPEVYESVSVTSDLDWKKWMEFHDAVLQPLVNAGAIVKIKVEVTGSSEEGISPNTVDLAVRESLAQYGIPADIQTKKARTTK